MQANPEAGQQSAGGTRTTWRSLTFQLLTIVVFPLIALLLVITFGSTTLHENAMRELVGDRDERAARMAATAIYDQIQRRANEARAVADQIAGPVDQITGPADQIAGPAGQLTGLLDPQAATVVIKNAAYLQDDFDAGIAVIRNSGQVIASREDSALWRAVETEIEQGLTALQKDPAQGVYVSNVIVQPGLSGPFMLVMAPGRDGQTWLAGAFYTGPLSEHVFANVFTPEQEASVIIIAPEGSILYRKGFESPDEVLSQHAGVNEALSGKYGTTYLKVENSEHVVAYSPVTPLGWALLIEEPWEQVASPLLQSTHMAPLVLVPVLLLALLAVFFGIRQIVQPLQALAGESSRLGWGDYGAIEKPVGGVFEIRQLQQELIHMAHKLRAAQQSLRSYIGAITSGQEEERRRLARELHDDTIQSLIAFKQRVQLVEMDWEDHPVAQALAELESVAETTIENLRRMVSALRPIYLEDLGLVAAIDMLAAETRRKINAPVEFRKQGQEKRLDAPVELALYRIVQEALSNITHHSGATQVSVEISFQARGIRILIEDNGKGFTVPISPAEFAPSGHFGLLGMFERAELIGGEIQVDSGPGKGTRLIMSAPYTTL